MRKSSINIWVEKMYIYNGKVFFFLHKIRGREEASQ